MNSAEALAHYRSFLARIGEDILVRRWSGVGSGRTKVQAQIRARVSGYAPSQIIGAAVQGDIDVIALNDPDAAVPEGMVPLSELLPLSVDDKLVIRGEEKSIKGVNDNTRRISGVLIALDIHAKG
jgi:hypothetical protein